MISCSYIKQLNENLIDLFIQIVDLFLSKITTGINDGNPVREWCNLNASHHRHVCIFNIKRETVHRKFVGIFIIYFRIFSYHCSHPNLLLSS